jgi:hypothetical protein
MKNLNLAITLSLLGCLLPTSRVTAGTKEPDYPWYMKTSSGQIIDLTRKACGGNMTIQAELDAPGTFSGEQSRSPRLEIAGIEINSAGLAKGRIINLSGQTVTVLRITALQGTNVIQINANTRIAPNSRANFSGVTIQGKSTGERTDDIQSWSDLSGQTHTDNFAGCIYAANIESEKFCKYH